MIRFIRYLFLIVIAVVVVTIALANREMVAVKMLPEEMSSVLGLATTWELPLYLVIFGGIVAGLLIGFIWEYLREHKYRSSLSKQDKQVVKLEREVDKLRNKTGEGKDDILALIE